MKRIIKLSFLRTKRLFVRKQKRIKTCGISHSVYPDRYLGYNEWNLKYNVSLLYKNKP